MKNVRNKRRFADKTAFERKSVHISEIEDVKEVGLDVRNGADGASDGSLDGDSNALAEEVKEQIKEQIKERTAYFVVNGAPTLFLNTIGEWERTGKIKYRLLFGQKDFLAAKAAGIETFTANVYKFSEREGQVFSLVENIRSGDLNAMEEAYAMRRLSEEFDMTQAQIAVMTERSRPAVANTLRLLTLVPEVIGMVESGQLSAGHARAFVKVPKDKQYPFALETVKKGVSVRETERAVKAYLTPPEVLASEKAQAAQAEKEELKTFVERARKVFRAKVSLIGNSKKGRVYIDYFSAEELMRLEECLDALEKTLD